jgi:hypothetical protein
MKSMFTQYEVNYKKTVFVSLLLLLVSVRGLSQYNVTEIITDYQGYWKTSSTAINSIKPDNSHNLVSFSFNGTRYSTGVNDALLASNGLSFIAGDYRALPVNSVSGAANANTKIGLGYMYDGVANGPGSPAPSNNIPQYLTDGIKGLDLGTCVANLPAGTLVFPVSKILVPSIGDNNPDVVITQIADPSGSLDRYEFADILGNRVGNYVDIQLDNISPVGNWTADFYDANKSPMTLAGGYTKTDRPLRLWASDLSSFGIDSSNASSVAYFRIRLSGNSDVAFVAYNNNSINIFNSLLPVKLTDFTGRNLNNEIQLNWQTASEINSDAFIIERSIDGNTFNAIGQIAASSNASTRLTYSYTDKNPVSGKNYYRLKMMDKDGYFDYSKVIIINRSETTGAGISLYPNPASSYIVVNHPFALGNEQLQVVSQQGNILLQKKITAGSFQTRVDLPSLPKAAYQLVWTNGKDVQASRLVVL